MRCRYATFRRLNVAETRRRYESEVFEVGTRPRPRAEGTRRKLEKENPLNFIPVRKEDENVYSPCASVTSLRASSEAFGCAFHSRLLMRKVQSSSNCFRNGDSDAKCVSSDGVE